MEASPCTTVNIGVFIQQPCKARSSTFVLTFRLEMSLMSFREDDSTVCVVSLTDYINWHLVEIYNEAVKILLNSIWPSNFLFDEELVRTVIQNEQLSLRFALC